MSARVSAHRLTCTRAILPASVVANIMALALMMTLLGACGGPRLVPEQPAGVNLSGPWRLNRAASEDPQALIARLQKKASKRMRPPADESFGDAQSVQGATRDRGPATSTDARPPEGSAAPPRSFRARAGREGFLAALYGQALGERLSGEGLLIEQSPGRFVITRGDSRRSYLPGGHSVVSVADGVADQVSGWKGREFVIDVRPQAGPHLTERFSLSAEGRLIEKVSLGEDGLPELEFTRVYDAGAAPARTLPTSN